ncbi:CLUMA_CG014922, isoform A [Clunio marinus]|uniref:CLUMA_CG014922, isoform A n=1 Tax=Clunio marinus TaxID=568069 RepID=A0A1J1IPR1_9DIPT|nr:CLUMA_CG014922, isoform A [Clunio marinus]
MGNLNRVDSDVDKFEIIELNETEKLLTHPGYDNNKPTVVYVYGFNEKFKSKSTQTLVESYIERGDHNILVVEWAKYNRGSYPYFVIPNTQKIGEIIGKVLLRMNKSGFKLENFHLVGHSAGGQLVGATGRNYKIFSNDEFEITRITALDPASPDFNDPDVEVVLISKNDGKFVDIIHTDSSLFGDDDSVGTVDFFPNGGRDQPGCVGLPEDFCSHQRSWQFYSESVRSKNVEIFNSVSCLSWENFKKNECEIIQKDVFMGIDADPQLAGNFFLQTNDQAPFNRGENGTSYQISYKEPNERNPNAFTNFFELMKFP